MREASGTSINAFILVKKREIIETDSFTWLLKGLHMNTRIASRVERTHNDIF